MKKSIPYSRYYYNINQKKNTETVVLIIKIDHTAKETQRAVIRLSIAIWFQIAIDLHRLPMRIELTENVHISWAGRISHPMTSHTKNRPLLNLN